MMTAGVLESEADQSLLMDAFEIDFIEEIRLRTWARKNYVPATERSEDWHPVILHEMVRMDQEF